jgi:hypothetical protein
MTTEQMNQIAGIIVTELAPDETQEFATILRHAIENAHTAQDQEKIYDGMAAAGLIVQGAICKAHPV